MLVGPAVCRPLCSAGTTTNVARGITPTVSSQCHTGNPTGKAYLTDGDSLHGSCPGNKKYWHSCSRTSHWARVDLGSAKHVSHIRVWPRCDCCRDQMAGAYAEILTSNVRLHCRGLSMTVAAGGSYEFLCNAVGEEVRISKRTSADSVLAISEIEVFGKPGEWRALRWGGPAWTAGNTRESKQPNGRPILTRQYTPRRPILARPTAQPTRHPILTRRNGPKLPILTRHPQTPNRDETTAAQPTPNRTSRHTQS